MSTSLLIEMMFRVMRKEHRFYNQRQKWLVDKDYFIQSQKWFFRNPLVMGCSKPTAKEKIVHHDRISAQELATMVQKRCIWHH
jgi:hypothetical protein